MFVYGSMATVPVSVSLAEPRTFPFFSVLECFKIVLYLSFSSWPLLKLTLMYFALCTQMWVTTMVTKRFILPRCAMDRSETCLVDFFFLDGYVGHESVHPVRFPAEPVFYYKQQCQLAYFPNEFVVVQHCWDLCSWGLRTNWLLKRRRLMEVVFLKRQVLARAS